MRSRSSPAFWPRRALAVAGLICLGAGLLMLTAAAPPAGAAASAGSRATAPRAGAQYPRAAAGEAPAATRTSRAEERQSQAQIKQLTGLTNADSVTHGPTKVTGQKLWNWQTNSPLPNPATVTVSQTRDLVNQQVQVSWANFTPSEPTTNPVYAQNTDYAVMVAECKGTDPASPADCYGAENAGKPGTSGPEGPLNTSYATTNTAFAGSTDIDILAKADVQSLGCDQTHPCSLVVVPAQGGNYSFTPAHCNDHTQDVGFGGNGDAEASNDFGTIPNQYLCSWAKRIVVPLTFSRATATCPLPNPVFSTTGSPMLARAMESWISALCSGPHGMFVNYSSQLPEPAALTDLGFHQTDVALTTRTATAQGINTGHKHYLYAPVAVTAVSIAYWFDNTVTGLPVTNVHLNQRLLLKLLTQSYAYENDGCPAAVTGTPCDSGVDRNTLDLFTDPEFLALNPDYTSQNGQAPVVQPPPTASIEVPTVQSGQSDITWTVTNWIDANKPASKFLAGQFDPDGNHINEFYKGLTYPNNTFISQDPFPLMSHEYTPVFPLSAVAADQVENWPPATSVTEDPVSHNFPRLNPQLPGDRSLVAVLDQGDSAAFLFPSAAIPNAAHKYVTPTVAHMTAALQDMTNAGDGTKQVNVLSKNKKAYPLTMVVYAVVPTSGTPHNKAAAIARFLDFAVGPGQHPGVQPGQLPPGFAPLPASMRAQTRKDAFDVLHQTGATAPKNNSNTGSGSSSSSNHNKNSGSSTSPAGATPSPGATGNPVSLVAVADARPASLTRYIFPALLILGGLAALAGSSSLIGSSSTPITARLRRIGRAPVAWSRVTRTRLGLRRSK